MNTSSNKAMNIIVVLASEQRNPFLTYFEKKSLVTKRKLSYLNLIIIGCLQCKVKSKTYRRTESIVKFLLCCLFLILKQRLLPIGNGANFDITWPRYGGDLLR
mmetsp:Transcript_4303/g.11133  ORF Transcript_4303/g.11133 Transcript_4303/m.11133 type:complete len:103 (+) Transcript_4303:1140-1448(+)